MKTLLKISTGILILSIIGIFIAFVNLSLRECETLVEPFLSFVEENTLGVFSSLGFGASSFLIIGILIYKGLS